MVEESPLRSEGETGWFPPLACPLLLLDIGMSPPRSEGESAGWFPPLACLLDILLQQDLPLLSADRDTGDKKDG